MYHCYTHNWSSAYLSCPQCTTTYTSSGVADVRIGVCNDCAAKDAELQALRSQVAALEAEVKLARERLGPAGYKVLERVKELESQLSTAQAENRTMREALINIQNAYGDPESDDYRTSEARAALAALEKGKADETTNG